MPSIRPRQRMTESLPNPSSDDLWTCRHFGTSRLRHRIAAVTRAELVALESRPARMMSFR
jgi:hypothetical protein